MKPPWPIPTSSPTSDARTNSDGSDVLISVAALVEAAVQQAESEPPSSSAQERKKLESSLLMAIEAGPMMGSLQHQ